MNSKKPTPQELSKVANEYTTTVNHLQELGLIKIVDDKGNIKATEAGRKVAEVLKK